MSKLPPSTTRPLSSSLDTRRFRPSSKLISSVSGLFNWKMGKIEGSLLYGYCPNDDDDESADDYTERDLALFDTNNSGTWRALEKRVSGRTYYVNIGNNVGIRIISLAYPAIAELFALENTSQILRLFFRLILGYCTGPSIQEGTTPPGNNPPGLNGLQADHSIDR
ncbi:MAG: hypothetical protein FRX48_03955 [Lasallia pustulata]|uniref:Uncharacterized protein n=1 Tax=Lasallia pustulata TaxID=136370 RepID=A0A5M8PRX6_9LECA|nr:MAG: hypothetical protein FRX48_03955 [Lasallia pustulata]